MMGNLRQGQGGRGAKAASRTDARKHEKGFCRFSETMEALFVS
jgi:hypothetical protein